MGEQIKNNNEDSRALDFVLEFEGRCSNFSDDIIEKICKKAIRKMNKVDAYLAGSTDDFPSSFNFFDILSIELQTKSYDEINPFLEDFVFSVLHDQFDNLPKLERLVLEYSECSKNLGVDLEAIEERIYNRFHRMVNDHYELKKIQNFVDRW